MAKQFALTTADNPYNPFEDFNRWWLFDVGHGYGTCSYLARIALTSDALSDEENEHEIERAIDEIIKYDPSNLYLKVSNEDKIDEKRQNLLKIANF